MLSLDNSPAIPLRKYLPMKMEQSVPKRQHIKFRRRGIVQKKAYNPLPANVENMVSSA